MPKWDKNPMSFHKTKWGYHFVNKDYSKPRNIPFLDILCYEDDKISIHITDTNSKLRTHEILIKENPQYPHNKIVFNEPTNDKKTLSEILGLINKVEPLGEEYVAISEMLKLPDFIYSEIISLININQFDEALQKAKYAQANGYPHAVMMLANYLENKWEEEKVNNVSYFQKAHEAYLAIPKDNPNSEEAVWLRARLLEKAENFQEAFEAFNAIPDNNPHFAQAHEVIVHLIYGTLDAASKGQTTLSSDQITNYREEQLRHSLKAGPDLQSITDQIYHVLCGEEGLNPDITNVKGDADTLIATARKIRQQNAKIKQLSAAPPDVQSKSTASSASKTFFADLSAGKGKAEDKSSRDRKRSTSGPK